MRSHQHGDEEHREAQGGTQFQGVLGLELTFDISRCGIGNPAPQPSARDAGSRESQKWRSQNRNQVSVEDGYKGGQPQIHHPGGDQGDSGEQVRPILPLGAFGQDHRRYRGRIGASQQCRQHYAALSLGDLLDHVTAVGDGAHRHHHQPNLGRIDGERSKFAVGQHRQNHCREQQELGEGEDLFRCDSLSETLKRALQLQQQHAGHGESGGDPELFAIHQRGCHVGNQR